MTHFLESLSAQLAERKVPFDRLRGQGDKLRAESEPEALPERPYKFLDYYEAKDAGIFYGRQQETQHLCALIHAHRLVLLYGASGVGKTSLLLAGAVPRLEQATPAYHAIYIRALEDPTLVIRRTLRRQLPDANLPDESVLVDFLAAVTKTLGQPLVIVLDQFEEFFIRLSPQFRAAFISELGALYDARDVPVKVIFSLREDWLASMDEIEERIPGLFRTRMRVSRLSETQAQQAITEPVKQLGISYEPALLERLLADLLGSNQEVMPPQLQLVCSALYDGRREQDRVLKIATYERLGGAQGVLHRYLEEELSRLDPIEQALARAILEELVTSEKTKAVKNSTELALALEVKLRILVPLLEWLVRGRLLRTLKQETGHRAYELAHEYLIHEISLTAESQARKEAEELLQQEVENGQRFGTVLAADKLALISDVGDLLRLNDDAQALLLKSALQVGQDIEYWLNRIPEPTRRVELLTKATQNKLTIVRQRAVEALGSQDVPQAVAPLLTLALHDRNMDIRDSARQSLAQLTTQQSAIVERLKEEVARSTQAENPTSRAALLRTLTYLPLSGLPLTLRLEVFMMRIRLRVTWFIQASLLTPQRRAMAMTTGVLIAIVGIGYLFSMNSYYLNYIRSEIRGGPNTIVISQGHPWLPSIGLESQMVDTGIDVNQIKDSQTFDEIENKELRGFWQDHNGGKYRKWGKQVSEVLKLKHRVPMLWYLGEKEDALQATLAEMTSQDAELHLISVVLLEQLVKVDPELLKANPRLSEKIMQALLPLLSDEESDVRFSAVSALGQVAEANPQLAEQVLQALLPLLSDEESDVRFSAVSALGLVVAEANPQLAEQVFQALLPLLSEEESNIRTNAAFAVGQVAEANPQLAEQVLQALFRLLKHEVGDVRANAAFAVGQVVEEANLQLAEQTIAELLPRLEDPHSNVRSSAAFTVVQVIEVNSQLAEQVIATLQPLLSDEHSNVRHAAVFAIGQVVETNPHLATEQQVMDALLPLLEHKEGYVRASTAFAVRQVAEANPKLVTEQVIAALLPSLEDKHTNVRASAAFVVGQMVEANSQLTEQVIAGLLPLLEHEDDYVRYKAPFIVGEVVKGNPQLAERVLQALLPLLEHKDDNVRNNAASAMGQALAAKPKQAQQHLKKFFDWLSDSDFFINQESTICHFTHALAANPHLAEQQYIDKIKEYLLSSKYNEGFSEYIYLDLGKVLAINGSYAKQVIPSLRPLLENSQAHSDAVLMLSYAYTHEDPSFLLEKLTDQRNTLERAVAARALFLKVLKQPSQDAGIGERLRELSESQEPIERIWANKTLAMLDLATQAHKVAQLEGEQREEATNRLQTPDPWDHDESGCGSFSSSGEEINFFGEEFSWAAWQAVTWLWEQENEGNLQTAAN